MPERLKGNPAQQTWVKYHGPLGGEGWKNVTTGKIVYGGADPNDEASDLHIRMEEARKRRMKERMERHGTAPTEALKAKLPDMEPSQQVQVQAQRAVNALQNVHGDATLTRLHEIATLVQEAFKKVPPERKDLRDALQKKMLELKAMAQTPQQKAIHAKKDEKIPAEPPQKPQSPFLPKRSNT